MLLLLTTWMPAWLGVLLVLYGDWIPCLRVLAAGRQLEFKGVAVGG